MKKNKSAFTMIELLMVMVITSVLGAVALPYFLDFRYEAKAAVIKQNLAVMRLGLKNQRLQAKLKCNYDKTGFEILGGMPFGTNHNFFWGGALLVNDITAVTGSGVICTTAQLPNPADRKFVQDPRLPLNPLVPERYSPNAQVYVVDTLWMAGYGYDACNIAWCSLPDFGVDWIYDTTSDEIHACSNTPGIHECSW